MGLIRLAAGAIGAASGAFNTTAGAAWTDYFESGDMSGGIIMKRGVKITGPNSRNKGDQNIISSGSGIDVQANQCMILVENGAIVDFCAEPGRYKYDASTAPSMFSGDNKGLAALASAFASSFAAGGGRTNTQRVFYINMGEIQGFKWGSGNITFDHWETDWNTGKPCWHIATTLMGNGTYSIQVTDPAKFFEVLGAAKAGGDGNGLITRQDIEPQIKTEAIAAIRQGVAGLGQLRIGYTDIAAHEYYQETKGYTDPSMLGAYMGMGNTQAMQAAAANSAGAVTGFAAMGMMGGNNMGSNIAQLMQQGQQAQPVNTYAQQAQAQGSWTCSCGSVNTGKFCPNCGSPKPEQPQGAFCPNCGQKFEEGATPRFCPNCGTKLG